MDSHVKIFISITDTTRNKWRHVRLLIDDLHLQMRAKEVGERVRQARETLRLTQDEFARRLGVTRVSVARYEAGRVPNFGLLRQIAQLAGVTVGWLLGGVTGEESPRGPNDRSSPREIAETHSHLLTFLKQEAAKIAPLPKPLRQEYEVRLHESIARLERELEEHRELLEGRARTADLRRKRPAKKSRPQ
jgi:transcriptional regulator with XRE-family HTH domain